MDRHRRACSAEEPARVRTQAWKCPLPMGVVEEFAMLRASHGDWQEMKPRMTHSLWKALQALIKIFYWSIVDLQDFMCTAKWFSYTHTHTYILSQILFPYRLFFLIYKFILFIYFWLHCVFVAASGLSLVVASGSYCLLRCAGFSLRWLPLLWNTGSRRVGFSSCGTRGQ